MDQRELHLQPLGICYRIYHFITNFITKTWASQALKTVTLGRAMHSGSTKVQTSGAGSTEDKVVIQPETKEQAEEKNHPCMNMNGEEKTVPEAERKAPKKMVSINDNVEEIRSDKKKKKRRSKSFQKSKSLEQQEEGEEEEEEEIKPLRSILKVKSNLHEKSMALR